VPRLLRPPLFQFVQTFGNLRAEAIKCRYCEGRNYVRRLAHSGFGAGHDGKFTDNAYIESFFHSMKADIMHGLTFTQDDEIEAPVRDYDPFYNGTWLHSSLNYVPPATYERLA